MKVLHINTFISAGGAETIVNLLFDSNSNSYLAVGFADTQKKNRTISLQDKGFYSKLFFVLNKLKWRYRKHLTFKTIFFLNEEMNNTFDVLFSMREYQDADIIHLHNIHGGYFDLDALLKIGKEKKIVWTLHDMWALTGGEAYVFDDKNYQIGIGKTNYKHVPPINNPLIDRRQYFIEKKKKIYEKIAQNLTFVCVSKWLENCLKSSFIYSNKINVQTIYNGYDDSIFYLNRVKENVVVRILIFNSNSPFKGAEKYPEIINNIQTPFELIVVGNDLTALNNKNLVKKYNYNFIDDRVELAKIYNMADVLIFNSKAEAFGLVPLEAMACGVCVFASNIGGIPEVIEHSETGFLYNNIVELISLLNIKLKDKINIYTIGQRASIKAKEKYNSQTMIDAYNKLYKSLL